jgi:hypothetical protein
MDGKVFSKENKDFVVKACDEAVKLPFYAEPFDGIVFTFLLNWIDKNADKLIPDTLDEAINKVVDAVEVKDWNTASEEAGTAINLLIDIPLFDEQTEQRVFVDALKMIIGLIQTWIANKKKESLPVE